MIIHIVLFKWKSDVAKGDIKKVTARVRLLRKKIPGIINIYCGENFSPWAEGFTHAIVVIAKNRKTLNTYRKDSDHIEIAQTIEGMEEKSLGVDFKN